MLAPIGDPAPGRLHSRKVTDSGPQHLLPDSPSTSPLKRRIENHQKGFLPTAWLKKILKLKKITESFGTLTAEDVLEAENFNIKRKEAIFYKDNCESLRNSNSVEKNSFLSNFVPFIDETEIVRLRRKLEYVIFL